jgi:hypothetical protein
VAVSGVYVPTAGFQVVQVATPEVIGAAVHPEIGVPLFENENVPVTVEGTTLAVKVTALPYVTKEFEIAKLEVVDT